MMRTMLVAILVTMSACVMAEDVPRTVTVSGTGAAEVKADRATVHMSIVSREKTLDVAQAGAGKVAAAVLAMTDRLGIERSFIDTTGASVRADYRWNREREEQEFRGYIAERQIVVDLRDLEKLGALVEGAVAAGVNQVSPPHLDSGERREAYREALAKAAEDARANAEVLATTLGARLGDAIAVTDGSAAPNPPVPYQMSMRSNAMSDEAAQTYNAADLSFSANVNVVFALQD